MGSAPDFSAVLESIAVLWAIWCARNDCVFRDSKVDTCSVVNNAYNLFQLCSNNLQNQPKRSSGLQVQGCGNADHKVILRKVVAAQEQGDITKIVTDAAWQKASWKRAVAWCCVDGMRRGRCQGALKVWAYGFYGGSIGCP